MAQGKSICPGNMHAYVNGHPHTYTHMHIHVHNTHRHAHKEQIHTYEHIYTNI